MNSCSNVTVYADRRVYRELVTYSLYQVREDQAANIYPPHRDDWIAVRARPARWA